MKKVVALNNYFQLSIKGHLTFISQVLIVKNQTTNLTPYDSFGHNLYVNLQMDM